MELELMSVLRMMRSPKSVWLEVGKGTTLLEMVVVTQTLQRQREVGSCLSQGSGDVGAGDVFDGTSLSSCWKK